MNGSVNDRIFRYIEKNSDEYIKLLRKLVKQPSVSTTGQGVKECSEMVRDILREKGFDVKLLGDEDAPVLFSECKVNEAYRTLMFYSHYDVVPPEPLEEWVCDPFSAEVRNGKIIGRGAADTKSSIVADVASVEAVREILGELPVNVKFVFEGEEEVDSANLIRLIKEKPELFRADGMVFEGGGISESGRPEISAGLKGSLIVEMRVKSAEVDQHSMWAPVVPNAAWMLSWSVTSLKNREEKILIDGFYDNVEAIRDEDYGALSKIEFNERTYKEVFGIRGFLKNLSGVELVKTLVFEPTCTICGFKSGYAEEGFKTINPKEAVAKIDFRLVPNQTCDEVFRKLRRYLVKHGFKDVECKILSKSEAFRTRLNDPIVRAVAGAAREVFGKEPSIWPMWPASISSVPHLVRLGVPATTGACITNPNSRFHAPNENIRIRDFINGIKHCAALLMKFAT